MAPTAVDCSWQLAWKRLGEGVCVCVCVLFLFLLISKQFQQVNCVCRQPGGVESWPRAGTVAGAALPRIQSSVSCSSSSVSAALRLTLVRGNRFRDGN